MTDTSNPQAVQPQEGWKRHVPKLKSRWWTGLLGLSLMLNLLVGGLALGHRFGPERAERMAGANLIQLVPRKFIADLPRDRRRELLKIVREAGKPFRDGPRHPAAQAVELAKVLEMEPYDAVVAKAAVDGFALGPDSTAARSSAIVWTVIAALTPEERKALAVAIRDRAETQQRRQKN
jgi:uncharacterized membrane protein